MVDFRAKTIPDHIAESALTSGGFPYDNHMKRDAYDEELRALQIEMVKMLDWVKRTGQRVMVVFEGRDAAGKGSTIKRMTEHLNPRNARIVALGKPTEQERGQWYFQRYIAHLPTRGEISIFDRSWYNRAGVEPVFGFCTPQETESFLAETPTFESMLARDGKVLIKFFLTIGPQMQVLRLHERWNDPLARWKLSDLDFRAREKWDDYSLAYERMLHRTDTPVTPWTIVRANDKRRSRLECIRYLLNKLPYAEKDEKLTQAIDSQIVLTATQFLGQGGETERKDNPDPSPDDKMPEGKKNGDKKSDKKSDRKSKN